MRRAAVLVSLVAVAAATLGLVPAVAHATTSAASSTRTPLRGTNWVLTDRVSIGTPLDGVNVNAVFGAKRVEGSSGCNGYSSSYTTNGARMRIRNDGVSTLIACEGAAGKVETKYLDALGRVRRWRITGTTLTLSNASGRRLLVYRASVGAPALRGNWNVTSVYTGNAISSPVEGSTLTLRFTNTEASGNGGCNPFSGPFEVSGADAITIGPLASTLRACADPAVDAQEQQYLAALGLATTYQVTGNQLTLFRDGGTIAVTAVRASQ
jgi:heat shock protein HslJ